MTDPAIHDEASRQASGPADAIRDAHDNLKVGIEIMGRVHDIPPQIHKAMHALSYAVKAAAALPTAPEPGWLQPALDSAAKRANAMPDWMVRRDATPPADAKAEPLRSNNVLMRDIADTFEKVRIVLRWTVKNARKVGPMYSHANTAMWALTETEKKLISILAAPPTVDRAAVIEAGKQARFKHGKGGWFGVTPDHNNPDSFEYRTIYALADAKGDGKP
jgi:hypothetical protein